MIEVVGHGGPGKVPVASGNRIKNALMILLQGARVRLKAVVPELMDYVNQ